jgi:hypothetical protein
MHAKTLIRWVLGAALSIVGCADLPDVPDVPDSDGVSQQSVDQSEQELSLRRLCAGPRGLACGADQYCSTRGGSCPSKAQYGVCAEKPEVCPQIFAPVCSCDGHTFSNACTAAAAGAAVQHQGACEQPTGPFCGGFAGIPCEGDAECIDDPSDDCDPKHGGADCGGICVPPTCDKDPCLAALCPTGTQCVERDCAPFCEPVSGPATCGTAICGPKTYCCNPLSNRCTPLGMFCAL